MVIRIHKGSGKPNTLRCLRDDGTVTWTALNLPAEHDLIHYVVETERGYQDAFYGLLARGWDIADFGAADAETGRKRRLPAEAICAECLVGIFQIELLHGSAPEDFVGLVETACAGCQVPTPDISAASLGAMRDRMRELTRRWARLPAGETLELEFAPS